MIISSISTLKAIDANLLVKINGWHNAFLDNMMWNISRRETWIALYVFMAICIVWKTISANQTNTKNSTSAPTSSTNKRIPTWLVALVLIASVGIAAGLADYISSGLIKHWVCRPRPTHEPTLEGTLHIVNGYRGGHYGFVSSHAANTMAVALSFSLVWKDWLTTMSLTLWVILNCYSRMYLGVHYPGDIVGGLIVGTVIALCVYWITYKTLPRTYIDSQIPKYSRYVLPTVFAVIVVLTMIL